MKKLQPLLILFLLVGSLAWGQDPFPSVTPASATAIQAFPIYTLNVAPMRGASRQVIGGYGQTTYCYWAVTNYQVGSVVSKLGCVSNGPATLSVSHYVLIAPFYYPPGNTGVDILQTSTEMVAPTGACNCAVATGVTSGTVSQTSNTLSSYTVPQFNPLNYALTLSGEVTGSNAVHLMLRQGWPAPGTLIQDLSTAAGGGCGTGTSGHFIEFTGTATCGNAPVVDNGTAGVAATIPTTGELTVATGAGLGNGELIVAGASAPDNTYLGDVPYATWASFSTEVTGCDWTNQVMTCASQDSSGHSASLTLHPNPGAAGGTITGAISDTFGDAFELIAPGSTLPARPQGVMATIPSGSLFSVVSGGSPVAQVTSGGSITTVAYVQPTQFGQNASNDFAGTCTMSSSTSCTITIAKSYTTPICFATVQSATVIAAGCTVSGTTVTITAASSNSSTWAAMVMGSPI